MRIGIICAIPNELRYFNFTEIPIQKFGERTFYKGSHDKHELILVQSGLGKVNAAVVSTLLIEKFECELLLFSGVAGGIDPGIEIGEVIIGESLIQYDYGTLKNRELLPFRPGSIPTGESKNELEYSLDPKIKHKIKVSLPNVRMGIILTGDVFLQCEETQKELFEKYGAQAIDMEGAAVAQVAEQFGIPAIVVRCLSDLAGADSQKLSSKFLNMAAKRSFNTAQRILKVLL
ncbi:MAG: 5'-methylthioadenosine/adenosylhomocysteine nucleosidase [SAR324 cluster bacterium]|jgi:adenosylhomocysteine nucleosidase|nr:5'-methylthioadenosine/adenosylhomocysteine nucleosidase [SAR324 cluster bacterium]MEC8972200.1 5'-methylthioadenosine/adenosylhomocysteine nucleosidase [SAR324 cluster bacterium]GIT70527.1 MAG: 5'-methylthioadenosine/S-adenosylhomocysteine nucleosidase [Pseudomonadota bacterium]|tara:strand:+ start:1813 stop:2508 length:696 start_codon:yes stop_codon:yes gene_type:complete